MAEETGGVIITPRDMYDEMVKLRTAVSELTPPVRRIEDLERRLRKVEQWKWSVPVSVVLAIAAAYLQTRS